ncbi:helix-turn-helix domain-containing protein [Mycobacterium avium]|uniref:helix-turn-helix domain-containing protein n=2 Tax=Mycobacterium avium TaxID=1764 RepID=UPI001009F388|nr:helix-turn-helix domain-containing protein [Mycobacterium avium]MDV3264922.1 helix-turn-helix domain-containing protein [Mycobacterium avium]UEA19097.1 helix-turn-helix domain-containing protein [Mycobacterium avium subsp. avium]UEA34691.1 helix-turn-helix domain-containing protein [Mycobacterium avium subsp. avium]UGU12483.1 helix-turn-helix domain-containing protein [Mycobacterium avium subsp. avium]UGU18444.1 helix-turn-helix domain-containing protein [Mycobacterium avium subsp. avium]
MSSDDYVLMDQKETSAVTRVPINTLKDWRAKGIKGPRSAVIGGRVMYRKVDVLAWIDEQFNQSGKGAPPNAGSIFKPLGKRSLLNV